MTTNNSIHLTQNIWAVGRNYAAHAQEMKAAIPKSPLFFLKSGGCLNSSSVIHLPNWSSDVHHEIEIAFRIDQDLNFSHVTLALDLTARDHQENAKKLGQPWTLAKSFTGSCPVGHWVSMSEISDINQLQFHLKKNNQIVQQGFAKDMIFKPAELLQFVKNHFPLQPNDILLTGTPEGVAALHSQDILEAELRFQDRSLLTCLWDVI